MAFRFKKASCVVAGTFNMYIIQPPWLAKINIFPKGTNIVMWSKLDEPGFRFQAQGIPSRWFVTPSRIDVETENQEEDCGAKVATVLSKLPWTPLRAIGNNTIYKAPLSELDVLPDLNHIQPPIPEGFELAQRSVHIGVTKGDQQYNLQVSVTTDIIELAVNVNTELTGKDADFSHQAARSFLDHRQQANHLIRHLLKARLEDAGNHHQPA